MKSEYVKNHIEKGGRSYVSVKGVFKQAHTYEQYLSFVSEQKRYRDERVKNKARQIIEYPNKSH